MPELWRFTTGEVLRVLRPAGDRGCALRTTHPARSAGRSVQPELGVAPHTARSVLEARVPDDRILAAADCALRAAVSAISRFEPALLSGAHTEHTLQRVPAGPGNESECGLGQGGGAGLTG